MALAVVKQRDDFDYDLVRVGDCFVDMSYGRDVTERALDRFKTWDDKKAGAIVLSLRPDGRYAILDGGHRVTKYREMHGDDAKMHALIYIDLTPQEEADLWSGLNDRKKILPHEQFKSDLRALHPDAVEIQGILDALDLRFIETGGPKDGVIQGVEAVRKIYRDYGPNSLRAILGTLKSTMGTGEGAIQAAVIKGLAAFAVRYYNHEYFDKERLDSILETHSAAQLKSLAGTIRSASRGDTVTAMGMAILQLYNQGLRRRLLPPWQAIRGAEA